MCGEVHPSLTTLRVSGLILLSNITARGEGFGEAAAAPRLGVFGEIVDDEAGVADETRILGEETEILDGSFASSSVCVSILLNIIEFSV